MEHEEFKQLLREKRKHDFAVFMTFLIVTISIFCIFYTFFDILFKDIVINNVERIVQICCSAVIGFTITRHIEF